MATESNHRYAILTETNGGEYETWYTFIRYDGNEEAIHNLDEQFKKIRFYIIDELSTFEIEYKRLVCEQTAREMCKMDLNSYMFHRKFDGKLSLIDFGFSKNDRNDDRIEKINDKIGMGDIDRYIDNEDPCDSDFESVSDSQSVRSNSDSESDAGSDRGSDDDRYYRERNDRNGNDRNDRNRRYSYSSDESEKKESPPRYKNDQKGSKSSNELKNDKGKSFNDSKNDKGKSFNDSNNSKNDSKNDLKNDQKGSKNSNDSNNSKNDLKNDQKGSKNSNDSKVNKDSKTKG